MSRFLACLGFWWCLASAAVAEVSVPEPLQPWRAWVLHGHPDATCPFVSADVGRSCVWPSRLNLALTKDGGRFELQLDVFAKAWVTLPGGEQLWPQNVTAEKGATALAVVNRDGQPEVLLGEGRYTLSGTWDWAELPRELMVPAHTGILQLTLNGVIVTDPTFSESNKVWLTAEQTTTKPAESDSLSVKVFRKITDSNPMLIETRIELNVGGKEREVVMGPMLLPGFVPRELESDLPARIEPDGSLRVQVRPGRWNIQSVAHNPAWITELSYKLIGDQWPEQEVWVFAASPDLRTVQLDGAPVIDGSQTQLPGDWQSLPAYLLTPSNQLAFKVLHRGDPNPTANQLTLNKEIWLDFNGGYTVKDQIQGTMHQTWRLEANDAYTLGRVELDGTPQLLTRLAEGGKAGVEVRQRQLNLIAVSRVDTPSTVLGSSLPVSGWLADFNEVSTTLHLPPGWSLFHISGADKVYSGWLTGWSLWEIFLVLVIAVSIGKVTRPIIGVLALATLVFTFQRANSPVYIWLNLTAALAILPYAKGQFHAWLSRYLALSFVALLIIVLPFIVHQARVAIYPQLEINAISSPRLETADFPEEAPAPEVQSVMIPEMMMKPASPMAGGRATSKSDSSLSSMQYNVPSYDPTQKIQVGPGLPSWNWHGASASWSGPVQANENTRLILVSPWLNRLGSVLSLLLVLLLSVALGQHFRQLAGDWFSRAKTVLASGAAALLLVFCLPAPEVSADVSIDKELLTELEQRLTQPPVCSPQCTAIESVALSSSGDNLRLVLQVHSAADLAFRLPAEIQQWWPSTVTVDNSASATLANRDGVLFVRLTEGRHQLTLSGPFPSQDSFSLAFDQAIQNVQLQVQGWRVSGLPDAKQASQTLQLQREQVSVRNSAQSRLLSDPVQPFVEVHRTIDLGLEWRVSTRVVRVAPSDGVINLAVKLLPGETPTGGHVNSDKTMDVRFAPDQQEVNWDSTLKVQSPLELTAPAVPFAVEVWQLVTSPMWHSSFTGVQPIATSRQDVNPVWLPWPGESVTIKVDRPQPLVGGQISIDDVGLSQQLGNRSTLTTLSLTLRASYGGQFELPIPADSQLKQVTIDGRDTPISYSQNVLQIPIHPGSQSVSVQWQEDSGAQLRNTTPLMDLKLPSTNIKLDIQLPSDRWVLFVGGPAMGPAILFWGVLAVVLLLTVALVRSGLTPLKGYEWILLSLGIATFNVIILALVAAWFVVMRWRGQWTAESRTPSFNGLQVLLFLFSIITLGCLVSSIPYSLLATPEMYVVGNNSSASVLQWYHDKSAGALPQGWVISLPMMVYRIVMLLWSLWLAFSLMSWIRWAWLQLGVQGHWFTPASVPATAEKSTPETVAQNLQTNDEVKQAD